MTAWTSSSPSSDGTPMTATSFTTGCLRTNDSTSNDEMFSPHIPVSAPLCFRTATFRPLGPIVTTRLVDDRTAVAVPATIVDQVGQRR